MSSPDTTTADVPSAEMGQAQTKSEETNDDVDPSSNNDQHLPAAGQQIEEEEPSVAQMLPPPAGLVDSAQLQLLPSSAETVSLDLNISQDETDLLAHVPLEGDLDQPAELHTQPDVLAAAEASTHQRDEPVSMDEAPAPPTESGEEPLQHFTVGEMEFNVNFDEEGEHLAYLTWEGDDEHGAMDIAEGEQQGPTTTTTSRESPEGGSTTAPQQEQLPEGGPPAPQQTQQEEEQKQPAATEDKPKPPEMNELSPEEKQQVLAAMLDAFNASHPLEVVGLTGDTSTTDLEPAFAEFGKVLSIVVEPARREVAIVRMPRDAAQKAKDHFAEHPLKVNDKQLQVHDAVLECFLFVGNLNDDVEPEHLRDLFKTHGEPERIIVMRSDLTGRKKGYGFVEMRTKAQAGAAKAILGGFGFHGRSLRIDWCRLSKLEELHSPVLFVDKLPSNFTDYNALRQLFLQYGKVKNVTVPVNPMTSFPRGFAFITFELAQNAETARNALDNTNFQGAVIRISYGNPSKADIAFQDRPPMSLPFRYGGSMGYGRGGFGYSPSMPYSGRGGRGYFYGAGSFSPMRPMSWGRGYGYDQPGPGSPSFGYGGRGFMPNARGRGFPSTTPTAGQPYVGFTPPVTSRPSNEGYGYGPSYASPGPYGASGPGPGPYRPVGAPILPTPPIRVGPPPGGPRNSTAGAPYANYRPSTSGPSYSTGYGMTATPPVYAPAPPQAASPAGAAAQRPAGYGYPQQPLPVHVPSPPVSLHRPPVNQFRQSGPPPATGGAGYYGVPHVSTRPPTTMPGAPSPTRPSPAPVARVAPGPVITSATYNYYAQQTQPQGGAAMGGGVGGHKRTHEDMQRPSPQSAAGGQGSFQSYPPTQPGFVPYMPATAQAAPKRPHY